MKNLKDFILEGAWGYEPNQNDGALDLRSEIMLGFCELVYDKCSKGHKSYTSTDSAWEQLGNIEYFFEELTKLSTFNCGDKYEFDKYYYWFRLIDKKSSKNIFNLYEKLLNQCINDSEWISGWSNPDEMRESLNKRTQILYRYKKLLNDKEKYDQEMKLKRDQFKQAEAKIQIKFEEN